MPTDQAPSPRTPTSREKSASELFPLVYDQLRAVARQRMAMERSFGAGHTLQPTAVVHEAFARLARDPQAENNWKDQREFFLAAAREMERVLIDHARAKFAQKRGGDPAAGGHIRIPLDVLELARSADGGSALALHEALLRLEEEEPQAAAVVRLRFFAGLSAPEAAKALGISERTVVREWTFARAFLAAELQGEDESGGGAASREAS